MIAIRFENRREFEYDVYNLVKAFYPTEEVSVLDGPDLPTACEQRISLYYGRQKVTIRIELLTRERARFEEGLWFAFDRERRETKNRVKRLLYRMLEARTGRTLPWGTLTGVRPVKIPSALLEEEKSGEETARIMEETYLVSPEKTALAVRVAERERDLLAQADYPRGYSIYIGIPFCPSICSYCTFSSSPLSRWKDQVDDYLNALCLEIKETAKLWGGQAPDTVYLGGGTPTTLEPLQLERLLVQLEESYDLAHLKEFTVEAGRPDSITREKLAVLRRHPVSRISVNPQTMNQKTLDLIGRRHTVEEIRAAFALARGLGFDNINMDLIVGLPDEGQEEVEHTMREVTALGPDSITIHSLARKRASRLNLCREDYSERSFANSSEMMEMTARYAKEAGMVPYYLYRQKNSPGNFENVGYAVPGKEGIYNVLIMEEKQTILALGAGASTKFVTGERIERVENVKDIRQYLSRIDEMIDRKRQGYAKYGEKEV